MRGLITRWLMTEGETVRDPSFRARVGQLEGWVSVLVNLMLGGAKIFLGGIFNSVGLISDGVHSLSDMATSLVIIVGYQISKKPADNEHPFGHQKIEHVATLIIAVLLAIAGFEIGKEAVLGLLRPSSDVPAEPLGWPMFAVLLAMLLAKEMLAWFSYGLGRVIDSSALMADGWHHRTDALTTGIVILGLAGRNWGVYWLDGAAGALVSLYIIWTGIQMGYQAVSPLLGESAPDEDLQKIRDISGRVREVVSVHDIRMQFFGNFYFTTLHVELSDRLDVHRMHEITVQIETRILKAFPGECVVHVDPIDIHHPLFVPVNEALRSVVLAHPDLLDFHDLHLWEEEGSNRCDVEISVEPEAGENQYDSLNYYVLREMAGRFPQLKLEIQFKVDFSAKPLTTEPG